MVSAKKDRANKLYQFYIMKEESSGTLISFNKSITFVLYYLLFGFHKLQIGWPKIKFSSTKSSTNRRCLSLYFGLEAVQLIVAHTQ